MHNHHHELHPPIDAYIDWEDNPQLAAYYAEYGKPGKTTNPSSSRNSGSSIGIGKLIIAIIIMSIPCSAFLIIGGIVYTLTGSAIAILVTAILVAVSFIIALVVVIKKFLKK